MNGGVRNLMVVFAVVRDERTKTIAARKTSTAPRNCPRGGRCQCWIAHSATKQTPKTRERKVMNVKK